MPKHAITLEGSWQLALDPQPCRLDCPPNAFPQTMTLPGTTAQQGIGIYSHARNEGFLSEAYPFSGQIWLRKIVEIPAAFCGCPVQLFLERTRRTKLWVNGEYVGSEDSLCTPHTYDLSAFTEKSKGRLELTLCVSNINYPTAGGHMTSPDTQTNWIGITGEISLRCFAPAHLSQLRAFPDVTASNVTLRGILHGTPQIDAKLIGQTSESALLMLPETITLHAEAEAGAFTVTIPLPKDAPLWSEYHPQTITLTLMLPADEMATVTFGLRDFRATNTQFTINGLPTMLRGKHDGLVFPLTGAAPTDLESWMHVLRTAKEWGINHYRFHTCCPPEACFTAADALGIYLEPELPFWGTIHALDDPQCKPAEQAYLVREGLRICAAFGNHPSFCMLSLGNELWGSPERLGEILDTLRAADPRPLYTMGSNCFQHMPLTIPQEDFWTGVRMGKGKLIRGSYATCDAPIGLLQTAAPATNWDYETYLAPTVERTHDAGISQGVSEIQIQYGTGVQTVQAIDTDVFCPQKPIVTHEIGQYAVYPDFHEISHYTGVLKARNFEIFRERLAKAGMAEQAEDFFRCSGALARDCYQLELEAAMRSPHLAGFQILDLQDFPGQGTALVGMLNALLENKGFITPEAWRGFCGDCVPMARFDSFVWLAGSTQKLSLCLRNHRPHLPAQTLSLTLTCNNETIWHQTCAVPAASPTLLELGTLAIDLPAASIGKAELHLVLGDITNHYALTILPPPTPLRWDVQPSVAVCHSWAKAKPLLQDGRRVLLFPEALRESIPGFYCADFWNYHMFRIISEDMGKEVPVGTMGLCIQSEHPVARALFSENYTTPQWYEILTHADCAILDAFPAGYRPIVQMIDNVERNHRLGILFEMRVDAGTMLVCTARLSEIPEDPAANRLAHALLAYAASESFAPHFSISTSLLEEIFAGEANAK